jgi:hypothetical protein
LPFIFVGKTGMCKFLGGVILHFIGIDATIKYYEVTSLLVVSFYKQDRKNSARPSNDYHRKLQRYRSLRRINKMQDYSSKKFTHKSNNKITEYKEVTS